MSQPPISNTGHALADSTASTVRQGLATLGALLVAGLEGEVVDLLRGERDAGVEAEVRQCALQRVDARGAVHEADVPARFYDVQNKSRYFS